MLRNGLLTLLLCLPLAAGAESSVWKFYGYAFDQKTNAYLYTEVHHHNVDGERWLNGVIDYYTPAGERFARKTMDFAQDPYVPVFRLDQPSLGYYEGITDAKGPIAMERRAKAGAPVKAASVDKAGPMAADSGFHTFLREHFAELMKGDTIEFRMVVAGNLDTFQFRATRIEDVPFEGRTAVRLQVGPATWLRFLFDPLELTYDPDTRMLLEYRGISNIHDAVGGKVYHTRITYTSVKPADAPEKLPPLDPLPEPFP